MRKLRLFFTGRLFPCLLLALIFFAAGAALTIWLPRALAPIAMVERAFSLVVAVFVAASPALPSTKTAKLLIILLLPWTGAFLCILWRNRAPMPEFVPRDPANSVAEEVANLAGNRPVFATSLLYFPVGAEAFCRMTDDIARATKRIYLEFYIIEEGKLFGRILPLLEKKAQAGVKVLIIADGLGSALTLSRTFFKTLRAKGIGFAIYRPVRFPLKGSNRRDHRKIAVIDDIAYTGGINLADEYSGEKIRFGHWKDTAVRACGEPAEAFAALFCDHWKLLTGEVLPAGENPAKGNIPCALFSDDGEERVARCAPRVFSRLFARATRTLYINTPYLAPDRTLLDALKAAAYAGVDVRVMIPHIPDKRAIFLITRHCARELQDAGVKVREYEAGFLHAKSLVLDGSCAAVSSYNLDCRSLYLQAECGLFAQDAALARDLERDFLAAWETGVSVPKANTFERLTGAILRLFTPLV